MTDTTAGIRTRFRAQVRQEAKQVALRQLEHGGAQALSVNAVARELGVSGPALYRYFTNRDALLGELVEDAYDDLTTALEAVTVEPGDGPATGVRAVADAYRDWARRQPHRYRLLFTAPVVDFDAQAEQLVSAAQRTMDAVLLVLTELEPAAARSLAITVWTLLHGFVSLEIEGNFASMGLDTDSLFRTQLDSVLGRGSG